MTKLNKFDKANWFLVAAIALAVLCEPIADGIMYLLKAGI